MSNDLEHRPTDNAVTRAITRYPFFAPGILRMKVSVDFTVKTAKVDGREMRINPLFMESLTPEQRLFVILHEWYHVMFLHHIRREDRNINRWKRACDYEVNAALNLLDRVDLIPGVLHDRKYDDMVAEQIYDYLEDEDESSGEKSGDADFSDVGEVEDHPESQDASSEQMKELEEKVLSDIREGAQLAKMAGKLPDNLERLLGELVEAKIDWRSELINFVQSRSRDDYCFTRPNTRYLHTGFILPTLYSETIQCLVFAGDTSCSITPDELKEYTSDLVSAFESVPIEELVIIWVDTEVQRVQNFSKGDTITPKPKGGGGTDFKPPFNYVEKEGLNPACLIYLTDGYCSSFAPEPDYPVLWCVYGGNKGFTPPYGNVLQVEF